MGDAERPARPWLGLALRAVAAVVLIVVAVRLPYQYSPETNKIFSQVMYLAIAAMGLNLLTGFNGQISIGHGAFFGMGAYTSAILVVDHGWQIESTIPVAALVAGVVGLAVGIPALRVKGPYLALLTLGLAVLFPALAKHYVQGKGGGSTYKLRFRDVTSRFDGVPDDIYRYYVCLLVLVLLFVLASNLMRSRAGRAIIAVRDQEVAASTVGIDVARVKVMTFALSAAYAGAAGGLFALVDRTVDASNPLVFFQQSIEFLIIVVIGGTGTISGPLLGAALLVWIRRRTEGTEAMAPALLGGALILAVYVLPDGIVGGLRRLWVRVSSLARGGPPAPPANPLTSPAPAGSTSTQPPT